MGWVVPSLKRKVINLLFRQDTEQLENIPSLVTFPVTPKQYPLHVIVDAVQIGGTAVGDSTNPDDNFTSVGVLEAGTAIKGGFTNASTANTDYTAYTPTAGKTGFLTSITVGTTAGSSCVFKLDDNATGATSFYVVVGTTTNPGGVTIAFPTPFKIATKLVFNSNQTATSYIGYSGYER